MDWNFPTKEETYDWYSVFVAKKILVGEMKPIDGIKVMNEFYNSTRLDEKFTRWNSLFWLREDFLQEEYDELVKNEAKVFLEGYPIIYPENLEEKPLFDSVKKEDSLLTKLLKLFS